MSSKKVDIYVNGEKQSKTIKKARLSDDGKKLNDVVKEFIERKVK